MFHLAKKQEVAYKPKNVFTFCQSKSFVRLFASRTTFTGGRLI